MNTILILSLLLIIVIIYIIWKYEKYEKFFSYQMFQQFVPMNTYKYPNWYNPNWNNPMINGYNVLPYMNTLVGNTSNMSYDIRGDPLVIPREPYIWNNPETYPIYNVGI